MRGAPLSTLLDYAVELAWRAGRVTLGHFQSGLAAEAKADLSPVTMADREAERVMRESISTHFPNDGILGEEFGETNPGARRRWIIDPIDGTRSFIHGVPLYGVLLALEDGGESVIGVMHFPALGESVWAARGEGCWFNGRRARVSDTFEIADALVLTTDVQLLEAEGHRAGWDRLRARAGLTRTWGDCYGYALVATGRAEAMLDPLAAPWDSAPLMPIIEEAGGTFTDWNGQPTHVGGSAIATNAALAGEIRTLLGAE